MAWKLGPLNKSDQQNSGLVAVCYAATIFSNLG